MPPLSTARSPAEALAAYMSEGDLFGYVASFLVFTTFYMTRMIPLRLTAIVSNVAFISYAWLDHLTPILILHGALLPLNLYRLVELRRRVAKVLRASSDQFSIDALLPLMQRRSVDANDVLFKANDPAEALYYVLEGILHLPELDMELGPGSIFGEFALFSDSGRRTATAVARTDCIVMSLTKAAVLSALVHHPEVGIYLLKIGDGANAGERPNAQPLVAAGNDLADRVALRRQAPKVGVGLGHLR